MLSLRQSVQGHNLDVEAIVCPKSEFDEWHNVYVCLRTTQDMGWQFYHNV